MELDGQKQGILVDSVTEIINVIVQGSTGAAKHLCPLGTGKCESGQSIGNRDHNDERGRESDYSGTCQKKDKLYILLSINNLMKDDDNV